MKNIYFFYFARFFCIMEADFVVPNYTTKFDSIYSFWLCLIYNESTGQVCHICRFMLGRCDACVRAWRHIEQNVLLPAATSFGSLWIQCSRCKLFGFPFIVLPLICWISHLGCVLSWFWATYINSFLPDASASALWRSLIFDMLK